MNSRWRPAWSDDPVLCGLKSEIGRTYDAVNAVCHQKRELAASGKYSAQGLTQEVRAIAKKVAVPGLLKTRDTVAAASSAIEQKRATLVLPKADPADGAGAVLRSEMRQWLRSLSRGEALAALIAADVDDRLILAFLETPTAMLGDLSEIQERVQDHVLEKKYGPQLKRLTDRQEAVDLTNAALGISLYQLRQEAAFSGSDSQFEEWLTAA
jgi:hypothetical protein